MATCSAQSLLESGKCFQCLSKKELQIVIAQLLCEISSSGGGGGSGTGQAGIVGTDADPNGVHTAEPGTIYADRTLKTFWIKETGSGNTGWQQYV